MTAAHEAVKFWANWWHQVGKDQVNQSALSFVSRSDHDQIPQIITDLRARGEWPEGLRVVGEEQR